MIHRPSLAQLDRAAMTRIWLCIGPTDMRRGFDRLAEQQMKRIALLRKNVLFVATPRGGETAAILSSLTSSCRRHELNPPAYLTQLLAHLPDTPISRIDESPPNERKEPSASPPAASTPVQT